MKILIVTQYYYPERFSTTDIAESFVKLGHDVTVLTAKPNYGFDHIPSEYKKIKYEEINRVKVHRVNIHERGKNAISLSLNYLSFHRNAKRYVKKLKEKFDVVLAVSLSPVISVSPALLYSKIHKVPCVLYCEDIWPESVVSAKAIKKNSIAYKILYKWSKSIYQRCDEIIISSPSFKDYFVKELNVADKKFPIVYQPVLSSKGEEKPVEYNNKHNIVYAGNIGEVQNVDLLVKAMKFVKTSDVKLHLLGVGSNLEHIKKLIVNDNLHNVVAYEGSYPIEKAESYFKNADALVVTLKDDGYVGKTIPNKAIQYLRYARPILGVLNGDGRDLLSEAKGSVFASQDPESIAEAIDSLCKLSKANQSKMGENNLKFYKSKLESSKSIKELLSLLEKVSK